MGKRGGKERKKGSKREREKKEREEDRRERKRTEGRTMDEEWEGGREREGGSSEY